MHRSVDYKHVVPFLKIDKCVGSVNSRALFELVGMRW